MINNYIHAPYYFFNFDDRDFQVNRLPIIEKTNDSKRKIKQLYDSDSVLFEETLLVSNNIKYSICFVPKAEVYDVIIEDFENNFTKYQVFHKLSPSTLKYFNLLKGESYLDDFGNEFKCISHTIEY